MKLDTLIKLLDALRGPLGDDARISIQVSYIGGQEDDLLFAVSSLDSVAISDGAIRLEGHEI